MYSVKVAEIHTVHYLLGSCFEINKWAQFEIIFMKIIALSCKNGKQNYGFLKKAMK